MKIDWKSVLDLLVPKHITLSQEKQQEILRKAEARFAEQNNPKRKWQPATVGVLLVALSCLFGIAMLHEDSSKQELQISYSTGSSSSKLKEEINASTVEREYKMKNNSINGALMKNQKILKVKVKWGKNEEIIQLKLK